MRLFISIPMNGRTDEEVFAEIEQIKKVFNDYISETAPDESVEFVNTFIQDEAPDECIAKPVWYLGESIKILSTCDAILKAPNSHKSRGCHIEQQVAKTYGLDTYNLCGGEKDSISIWRITKHEKSIPLIVLERRSKYG